MYTHKKNLFLLRIYTTNSLVFGEKLFFVFCLLPLFVSPLLKFSKNYDHFKST